MLMSMEMEDGRGCGLLLKLSKMKGIEIGR